MHRIFSTINICSVPQTCELQSDQIKRGLAAVKRSESSPYFRPVRNVTCDFKARFDGARTMERNTRDVHMYNNVRASGRTIVT